jgi:phytoene synthase
MLRDLDILVRRVDEDRWLASRFASPEVRGRLIALYAVNYEIARTAESVSEPALGDIRLRWWLEALEAMSDDERSAPRHPALEAMRQTWDAEARRVFSRLHAIAEARRADLEASPFQTWDDVDCYVDATAGGLMRLALEACGTGADEHTQALVVHAGRAWGFTGLLRAEPFWRDRGRNVLPRESGSLEALRARAAQEYSPARFLAPRVHSRAFSAIGYVALAPAYLRASAQGRDQPSLFHRQMKLVFAAATGRI